MGTFLSFDIRLLNNIKFTLYAGTYSLRGFLGDFFIFFENMNYSPALKQEFNPAFKGDVILLGRVPAVDSWS
jgi:hypothetical protein